MVKYALHLPVRPLFENDSKLIVTKGRQSVTHASLIGLKVPQKDLFYFRRRPHYFLLQPALCHSEAILGNAIHQDREKIIVKPGENEACEPILIFRQ